jgi:bifunctional non-homologous end joining protein LigD
LFAGYAPLQCVGTTTSPPNWIKPQLTRLVDEAPAGRCWLHEIKYDGYRVHARIDGRDIKLLTRTGLDWSHRYRRTIDALGSLKAKSAYLDGELCALNSDGVPVFSRLQAAMDEGRTDQLVFFAFDLLFLNGVSTAQLPLIKRKGRLQRLFKKEIWGLRYSEHVTGDGPGFPRTSLPPRSRGRYLQAGRSALCARRPGIWVKSKCLNREELSWSTGQIRRAADHTAAHCCWVTTRTTPDSTTPGVPAPA